MMIETTLTPKKAGQCFASHFLVEHSITFHAQAMQVFVLFSFKLVLQIYIR